MLWNTARRVTGHLVVLLFPEGIVKMVAFEWLSYVWTSKGSLISLYALWSIKRVVITVFRRG